MENLLFIMWSWHVLQRKDLLFVLPHCPLVDFPTEIYEVWWKKNLSKKWKQRSKEIWLDLDKEGNSDEKLKKRRQELLRWKSGDMNDNQTTKRKKKKNTLKWIWEKKKKKLRFEVSSPLKEIVLSFKVRNRTKFFCYLYIFHKSSKQRSCPPLFVV